MSAPNSGVEFRADSRPYAKNFRASRLGGPPVEDMLQEWTYGGFRVIHVAEGSWSHAWLTWDLKDMHAIV